MNLEVKILLKKLGFFISPVIIWIFIVVLIDPFNYFNISNVISQTSKEKSAKKLNSLLYNTIYYKNNPTKNIIIGDSRIRKLPVKKIKELTGETYYTLHSNAAKLNELIDLFWLSTEYADIENIVIGINFNIYNQYAYANNVADVKALLKNPLIYIFNWNIAETIYLSIKNEFFGIQKNKTTNEKDFWSHTIKNVAHNHYAKWKHPQKLLLELQKIDRYCKKNNINLILLIVPHHKEFHDRLKDYNLESAELRFKEEIKTIGKVVDYDFSNEITNCKKCFGDPIHTTDSIGEIIVTELFSKNLKIGTLLH